jgi:uroporphyrinogen-III synthase
MSRSRRNAGLGFFLQLAAFPPEAAIISIGPATTEFLVEKQIMPVYEAMDHDLNGVLEVLDVLFGQAAPA